MNQQDPDERVRQLSERLQELATTIARMTALMRRLRTKLPALQAQRRSIVEELKEARTTAKAGLTDRVMSRVQSGMTARAIARELKESPAVVSRIVEKAKAEARKRGHGRRTSESDHRTRR